MFCVLHMLATISLAQLLFFLILAKIHRKYYFIIHFYKTAQNCYNNESIIMHGVVVDAYLAQETRQTDIVKLVKIFL